MKNHLERTIRRYDEISGRYHQQFGVLDSAQKRQLDEFISHLKGKRVLDVGCGTGKDLAYFRERGLDVYGVDLSPGMLDEARRHNPGLQNISLMDMRKLGFKDNFFDGVWCNTALVHLNLKEKEEAIKEFHRVLQSEGILHITHQNIFYPRYLYKCILNLRSSYWFDGRLFFPTNREVIQSILKRNFDVLKKGNVLARFITLLAKKRE